MIDLIFFLLFFISCFARNKIDMRSILSDKFKNSIYIVAREKYNYVVLCYKSKHGTWRKISRELNFTLLLSGIVFVDMLKIFIKK